MMPRPLSGLVTYGDSLPGLTADQQARFEAGKREFSTEEDATEGLGPVFNDTTCANCHSGPAVGGGSTVLETRFGRADGLAFDPMTEFGGSLMQSRAIDRLRECGHTGETVPAAANRIALRRTTPLFGLGLVDAVPDATFHAIAAAERDNPDDIGGRPHVVRNVVTNQLAVGRFGWKAQGPTLLQSFDCRSPKSHDSPNRERRVGVLTTKAIGTSASISAQTEFGVTLRAPVWVANCPSSARSREGFRASVAATNNDPSLSWQDARCAHSIHRAQLFNADRNAR
jgi:hypothetical protein